MSKRILFFGAGVLGSLFAAKFKQSGHDVSILARGTRLQQIGTEGIDLEHAFTGERMSASVKVVEAIEPFDFYDYIIILVRKNQVEEALAVVGKNSASPNILVMVNNPSGYSDWVREVGEDRLMVGFAGAGGTIENGVVSYAIAPGFFQPTTLAELNGQKTGRLNEIVNIFRQAGFPTTTSSNMDAWQKNHVAWVSPLANAIYMAENYGLEISSARSILGLTVDAIREGYCVLANLDVPVTPKLLKLWQFLPKFLLVQSLAIWMKTNHFKTLILRHSLSARDEMSQIADEFDSLSAAAGVRTPALASLHKSITNQE